jgi:hypothetical protein
MSRDPSTPTAGAKRGTTGDTRAALDLAGEAELDSNQAVKEPGNYTYPTRNYAGTSPPPPPAGIAARGARGRAGSLEVASENYSKGGRGEGKVFSRLMVGLGGRGDGKCAVLSRRWLGLRATLVP